ncbi:Ig-like domain-containing protein [Acinetobacter chinensis]|uniref:Ig-like domain-containing protein n=1 Tax=Acinetobacter chinensis TaxID=2004650 RepID=A0ABU3WIF9_9GAMM|nr:BapA/Bap/LapF family large adhesin [Acinetobacter chinensis]MDV2470006.1 Ig-like domain-containing protein [Acinetobacter chinensis]
MSKIIVISKSSGKVIDKTDADGVVLTENSVISIKASKEDVAAITREGNTAIIQLKNGEVLKIDNFFTTPDNHIVFDNGSGDLYWAEFTNANGEIAETIKYHLMDSVEPLLYHDSGMGIWPWVGGAALIGGVAAAAGGGGGSDGKDGQNGQNGNSGTGTAPLAFAPQAYDNVGSVQKVLSYGDITDDNKPTFSGTGAVAGALIKIYDGNILVASTTADTSGKWEVELPSGVKDGVHNFSATQTVNGVESPQSSGLQINVDTLAPDPAKVTPSNPTNDSTPTITGTTEPGTKVDVVIKDDKGNVVSEGTATVDNNGNWTYTPDTALPDGKYDIEVKATDPAGNISDPSAPATVTVDTKAPDPAVVNPLPLTNDKTPTISGTAEPGSTVTVTIKDSSGKDVSGTVTADSSGNWSYTPTVDLADGTYQVTATATDKAGNISDPSVPVNVTVDATAPGVVVVNAPAVTNDKTPTISGTAEPGSTVTVTVKDSSGKDAVGTATADASGTWSYTPSTDLADGAYQVTATATDKAGNTSTPSVPVNVTVDATAPDPAVVNPLPLTNDKTPTISGTAEPGSTVTVTIKDSSGKDVSGTVTADPSGNWSYTPTVDLADGTYQVTATATDKAGNISDPSVPVNVTVDATAPGVVVVNAPAVTNDKTPTISGTAEPDSTVTVTVKDSNGKDAVGTATADASGTWSYTPSTDLADGTYQVTATATDKAGNTSTPSVPANVTVDATDPVVTIKPFSPFVTDRTPIVTGTTTEKDATVTVIIKNSAGTEVERGTASVDQNGNWTYKPSTLLPDGSYTVSVIAKDKAGNDSAEVSQPMQVDATPPKPVQIDPAGPTNDNTPELKGISDAGSVVTVAIKDSTGKVIESGPATVDASGAWTFTPSVTLLDGTYTVTATAKDQAGNTSDPSNSVSVTVDTVPPDIQITSPSTTNTATPEIKGTVEKDATVTVEVKDSQGNAVTGSVVVDTNGNWTWTPDSPLTDDTYTVIAKAKDEAGNEGNATLSGGLTVSATLLDAVVINNIDVTNDATPEITGSAPNGAVKVTVTIKDKAGKIVDTGDAVLDPVNGSWTYTPGTALSPDGEYTVTAGAENTLGTKSVPSLPMDFVLDTVAGPVTIDQIGNAAGLTNDSTPTISGTAEAGSTVTLTITGPSGALTPVTVQTGADGKWTYTPGTALTDGQYTVEAVSEDKAGNKNPAPVTDSFTLDATAPVGLMVQLETDTGVSATDGITSNGKILVSGLETGATWEYSLDGGKTWNAGAGSDFSTVDGKYDVQVRQTDAAGNSEVKNLGPITVDSAAPAAPSVNIVPNGSSINGTGEAGAVVTMEVVGGKTYSTIVDASGKFSVAVSPILIAGETVKAYQTDAAGNKSQNAIATAPNDPNLVLSLADNHVDFAVTVTPTVKESTAAELDALKKTSGVLVSAGLGPVLGAEVLTDVMKQAIQITVAEDTQRQMTFKGESGGVQVISMYDFLVYKKDPATGAWNLHEKSGQWLKAYLLGGVSDELSMTFNEGEYLVFLAPSAGVTALTGYTLKVLADVVLDFSNPVDVSGSVSGNMLTDLDINHGVDAVPAGSVIGKVNGTLIDTATASTETEIKGQYGSLFVKADGSYRYVIDPTFKGPFGSQEKFSYEVTSGGRTDTADLVITLENMPIEIAPPDIDATVILGVKPTEYAGPGIAKKTNFDVLKLGLLSPILDANAVNVDKQMKFSVADNTVRELTFKGDAGGVTIGAVYDLYIYKKDEITGKYVQYEVVKDWFSVVLLGGVSKPVTLGFPEGEYVAILGSATGVGLLQGASVEVTGDKIYDYSKPDVSSFTGQVTGDATETGTDTVIKVDNQAVSSGGSVIVNGVYGQLVIQADGTYTYTVTPPTGTGSWTPPYGQVETFTYLVRGADGKVRVETLNIKIDTLSAIDDINASPVNVSNKVVTEDVFTYDTGWSTSKTKTFSISEGQSADVTFTVRSSVTNLLGNNVTITLKDSTGAIIQTNAQIKALDSDDYEIKFTGLQAGNYTIEAKSTAILGNIYNFKGTAEKTFFNEFESQGVPAEVKGSLISNDLGAGTIASYSVAGQTVSALGVAKTITVQGLYGTLTVNEKGEYTYKPSGKAYGVETFEYTIKSEAGSGDTAKLTIDVGMNLTASANNDSVSSSGAADTFTMGSGSDTVIFKLLADADATGGNGMDTWTDFKKGNVPSVPDADKIDLHALLNDGKVNAGNLSDYVKVTFDQASGNTTVAIDRDGKATAYESTDLLVLKNTNATLQELLNNQQLLF